MQVTFEDRSEYLFAHFSGDYSLQDMLRAIDSIAAEATARKSTKVLIDVSISGDAPMSERYEYASYAARALRGIKRCAAFAGPAQRVEPFTQDVAQNRGFQLRVFREAGEAVRWLLG